jgi:hypothetical protein
MLEREPRHRREDRHAGAGELRADRKCGHQQLIGYRL